MTRRISSQRYLDLRVVAQKASPPAQELVVTTLLGSLDGEPVLALLNGHHALLAAERRGWAPRYVIRDELPEPEFRAYLAAHRADGAWYDFDTGAWVLGAIEARQAVPV